MALLIGKKKSVLGRLNKKKNGPVLCPRKKKDLSENRLRCRNEFVSQKS